MEPKLLQSQANKEFNCSIAAKQAGEQELKAKELKELNHLSLAI